MSPFIATAATVVDFEVIFASRYRLREIPKASPLLNLKWRRHASTAAAAGFSRIFVRLG